jgi:hypothetical protein
MPLPIGRKRSVETRVFCVVQFTIQTDYNFLVLKRVVVLFMPDYYKNGIALVAVFCQLLTSVS